MIFNISPGKFLSDKNNTNLGFNEVNYVLGHRMDPEEA